MDVLSLKKVEAYPMWLFNSVAFRNGWTKSLAKISIKTNILTKNLGLESREAKISTLKMRRRNSRRPSNCSWKDKTIKALFMGF